MLTITTGDPHRAFGRDVQQCSTCGGWSAALIGEAMTDHGEVARICVACLGADAAGLRERMRKYAARLRQKSAALSAAAAGAIAFVISDDSSSVH